MRRGLSFMLVMLLVLRGLLGDAMAMEMVPATVPNAQHHQHASQAAERSINDHGQHHAQDNALGAVITPAAACLAHESASASACGHASSPSCSACGICHSAFFSLDSLVQTVLPQQPWALPSSRSTPFASAVAAQVIKPPIS